MKLTKHCLWLVLVLVLASGSAVFAQTIVHWQHHSPARNEMIEFFAREFEAQNPGVTIEFESIPLADYYTKLLPALAAGSGPDVFQLRSGDVPRYKEYEVIQALNIDHARALKSLCPVPMAFSSKMVRSMACPQTCRLLSCFTTPRSRRTRHHRSSFHLRS